MARLPLFVFIAFSLAAQSVPTPASHFGHPNSSGYAVEALDIKIVNSVQGAIGTGHVVLFGMRPQYRAQSYQAFKLFFNSLVLAPVHAEATH